MIGGIQIAYSVGDNSSNAVDVDGGFGHIRVSGTATLSTGNFSISNSGAIVEAGCHVIVEYVGNVTYSNGYVVSIFGRNLTQQEAKSKLTILYIANGADFDVLVLPSSDNTQDRFKGFETTALSTAGSTITLDPNTHDDIQVFTGTGSLTGSSTVSGAAAKEGDRFLCIYQGTFTIGAFGISIFGVALTSDQVANGNVVILGYYDGSSWSGTLLSGQYLGKASQAEIETGTDNDKFVTSLRVAQKLTHWLANVVATFANKVTFTLGINLPNVSASQVLETDASKNVVSAAKNSGYNLPTGTTAGTLATGDDTRIILDQIDKVASFETDSVGDKDWLMKFPMTINTIQVIVDTDLDTHDDGTITFLKNGAAMTGGVQVIPAGTSAGVSYILTPTTNNVFAINDTLTIRTAKATKGGEVSNQINITKG